MRAKWNTDVLEVWQCWWQVFWTRQFPCLWVVYVKDRKLDSDIIIFNPIVVKGVITKLVCLGSPDDWTLDFDSLGGWRWEDWNIVLYDEMCGTDSLWCHVFSVALNKLRDTKFTNVIQIFLLLGWLRSIRHIPEPFQVNISWLSLLMMLSLSEGLPNPPWNYFASLEILNFSVNMWANVK